MKEIITYMAEDGKIFDDEAECVAYEFGLQISKVKEKIKVWDEEKNPLSLQNELDLEKIWYIKIENVEQCKILDDLHYKAGLYPPFDGRYKEDMTGFWWYDGGDFVNLTQRLVEIQEQISELQ